MKNHILKRSLSATTGLALVALAAGSANAAILYNITSFNNNNTETNVYWVAGITTISTAGGLTGTDDAGLLSLQNLRADATTATSGAPRFRNTEPSQNLVRQTVTTDIGDGSQYFQFGIDADAGQTITLTSLSFDAVRATGGGATRGYSIEVSIDGGSYTNIGAANIANNRNDGLANFDLPSAATGADTVDFRAFATGGGIEWTNFAINGEVVPVPEPSVAILGGLGFFALLRRRRS